MKIFLRILSIIIEVIVALAIFIMIVQKTPLFDRAIPGRSLPFSSINKSTTISSNTSNTKIIESSVKNNTTNQTGINKIYNEPVIIDQPVQKGLSCITPRGSYIADGSSIIAYNSQRANTTNQCYSEIRTCTNGILGGKFIYKTCDYIIDGQIVKSDGTREDIIDGASDSNQRMINLSKFYKKIQSTPKEYIQPNSYKDSSTLTLKQAKSQSMDNSKKSIVNNNISDTLDQNTRQDNHTTSNASCTTPRGEKVIHGSFTYAYNIDYNSIQNYCSVEKRACINGKLSGSFSYKSCDTKKENIQNIISTTPSIIYKGTLSPSSPYIRSLSDNIRDTLLRSNKSYNNNSQNLLQLKNCITPWGNTIKHNERTIAYRLPSEVNNSLCNEEVRVCRDGILGGSYNYQTCTKKNTLLSTSNNNETRIERNIKSIGKDTNNIFNWIKGWFK